MKSTVAHWGACAVVVLGLVVLCLGLPVRAMAAGLECANESLRLALNASALPDCRAYEMVSPPYKDGYSILVKSYAADGNKAILYSLGDLEGTPGAGESAIEGDVYLDVRTTAGWQLSPMNPSFSEYVGQIPVAYEAGDGEMLWKQHTPEQSESTRDLYVRSATGAFSLVGPLGLPNPPGTKEEPSNAIDTSEVRFDRPIAATSNYSHIVLEAPETSDFWPFDGTMGEAGSVYEYSGVGNQQPALVGVEGAKGSTHLIGSCGTEFGSGRGGSEYNALSANGESIFFTVAPQGRFSCTAPAPALANVYARLHNALSNSEEAKTVDVSASECTKACGPESGKNFEGASEDGQKVFFTSTQKLTNDAVDGTASGDADKEEGCNAMTVGPGLAGCNLYVYDFGKPEGARLKLVAGGGVLGVGAISEAGSRVYFVSQSEIAAAGLNEFGDGPQAEQPNLYMYDIATEEMSYITTLGGVDHQDWQRVFGRPVQVAGNEGQFLLFASTTANLIPDDKTGLTQLLEYNAETKELVRVTQGEGGYNENGNGVTFGVEPGSIANVLEPLGTRADYKSTTNRLNIATNGSTVVFVTRGALSPLALSAAQKCRSLYEFRSGGRIAEGSVDLLSDGRDTQLFKGVSCGPQFQGMDSSGANVLISTADPLSPNDVDGVQRDIYDVREDGGFAPSSGGSCIPSSCEEPSNGPPGFVSPNSVQAAEGNFPPVVHKVAVSKKKKTAKKSKKKTKKKSPKKKIKGKKADKGSKNRKPGSRVSKSQGGGA